ncbi:MAG: bifunctional methylenetetrahydrofolate dehydrogenase/methenyltetrahydrofolate cyclohydrolase FolD [Elusimicrobiota bacterium]
MAHIIDGKKISQQILLEVKDRASVFLKKTGKKPGLATVLVGDDPASHVYVGQKIKKSEENGLVSFHCPLPSNVSQQELIKTIENLNKDSAVHGILVQLPLPQHLDSDAAIKTIAPQKDADGLHPFNQGALIQMKSWKDISTSEIPVPCTPAGVIELLLREKIPVSGKHAVVVGRSTLVGKPVAQLLLSLDATVTMVHSKTENFEVICKSADILIAAIGRAQFIKSSAVKLGAVVIDVGINRTPQGLKGDVDFDEIQKTASAITPVPGGVGPMTVALLLQNTVKLAEKSI